MPGTPPSTTSGLRTYSSGPTSRRSSCPSYVVSWREIQRCTHALLQTVFAAVTAPASSSFRVALAVAWTWLHLITFNFSNQYRSVAEDKLNKPWRPIPAGRIRLETADRLRWLGCSACLGLSALGGRALFLSSAAFLVTAIAYDETTLSKHWFGKNVMGTIAYPTASAGATMLMRTCALTALCRHAADLPQAATSRSTRRRPSP
jgi:4-hydroxybenzoate polyprenyltransferase